MEHNLGVVMFSSTRALPSAISYAYLVLPFLYYVANKAHMQDRRAYLLLGFWWARFLALVPWSQHQVGVTLGSVDYEETDRTKPRLPAAWGQCRSSVAQIMPYQQATTLFSSRWEVPGLRQFHAAGASISQHRPMRARSAPCVPSDAVEQNGHHPRQVARGASSTRALSRMS